MADATDAHLRLSSSGEIESTPRLNRGAKDTMGSGEVLTASAEDSD